MTLGPVAGGLARREVGGDAPGGELRHRGIGYFEAVDQGMFRPPGQGAAGIAEILCSLEAHGYAGWYVMEQDAVLHQQPGPDAGPQAYVQAGLSDLAG